MTKNISNFSEVIARHHSFPINQNLNLYYLQPQKQNSPSFKHLHSSVTESKSSIDKYSQTNQTPLLSQQQKALHSYNTTKSREATQASKESERQKHMVNENDLEQNPEAQIPNETQTLKALLKRERKQKEYWKNYALKLQEQNKSLKEVLSDLRTSQKEFENTAIKQNQQLISQQIINQKLTLQKQVLKLRNQKKELTLRTKQLEKQLWKMKSQNLVAVNAINGKSERKFSRAEEINRYESDKREIDGLRKLVSEQQININEINSQLMGARIKILSQKYQKY